MLRFQNLLLWPPGKIGKPASADLRNRSLPEIAVQSPDSGRHHDTAGCCWVTQ
jgi:hypothetical protein